jgi:hypothetical protein
VRQAIEAFLAAEPEADSLAMLFLGQHLGPASRLEMLDEPDAAAALTGWFESTWTDRQTRRRQAAAAAIVAAVDHWLAEGWLAEDPAAMLR